MPQIPRKLYRFLVRLAILSWIILLCFLLYPTGRRRTYLRKSVDAILDDAIASHRDDFARLNSSTFYIDPSTIIRNFALQRSLSCLTQGIWALEPKQNFNRFTKRSNRAKASRFVFRSSCSPSLLRDTPVAGLCASLVATQILFVGPETTLYLHNLWLSALEAYENRSLSCEFCTFHHICRISSSQEHEDRGGRPQKLPRQEELIATHSSILRYVLSTTLYAENDAGDPAYRQPTIDPETGVRVKNAYWMAHARRAHVIIFNRGPLPAPAWTYTRHDTAGDWSFSDRLYLNSSSIYLADRNNSTAARVVNAALHATLTQFLPTTLRTLGVLESNLTIRQKLLIWHGSWYLQPRCSAGGSLSTVQSDLLLDKVLSSPLPVDHWTLYYNAQGSNSLRYQPATCLTAVNCSVHAELPHARYSAPLWDRLCPSRTSRYT